MHSIFVSESKVLHKSTFHQASHCFNMTMQHPIQHGSPPTSFRSRTLTSSHGVHALLTSIPLSICGMNLADGWDQGNSLLTIGKHWSKFCRRNGQNFPRTTPDNLSKACVRDAWNVFRHEEDIHIIEHCCLCLVYFILWHWLLCKTWTAHSVTFCDFWFSDQDAVHVILFLCNKDNHFLLGMWLLMDIAPYLCTKLFISMGWFFVCSLWK